MISEKIPTQGIREHLRSVLLGVASALFFFTAFSNPAADLAPSPRKLTYIDLVKRLTVLEYLAALPEPGEKTAQWSSYDRASRFDEQTGKYVRWDANGDNDGVIRKEGDRFVLAEMAGPGCIWRIWSATPKQGHVRIYLDGASEPAVNLPFTGYFDGKSAPFTRNALVHTTAANGWNNYTPIPYQKSCKILAEEGWGAYYQFTYTTFPQGTEVPTFKRELSPVDNAALDEANRILNNCGPRSDSRTASVGGKAGLLSADETTDTAMLEGPGAITGIRVKVELPAPPADRDALRAITLQIRWDDEQSPAVWSPLGDFFGTAPGANAYRSLPCGLTEDGWWYCNWFMPFAKKAEVTFKKEGSSPVKLEYQIATAPLNGDLSQYARFHAKWHRDALLPTEPERRIDWPMLKTEGRGRFVGVMLHVWNPRGGWWGEGDEKFFVDGEKFPSTFGTGSEDYFGYAWSSGKVFYHPLHNQPNNDGNSKGHLSLNRWQIADQVPFHKSFEGDIEKYYPNTKPTLYATTVYWYLEPGGRDPYPAVSLAERIGYDVPVAAQRVRGALEGESLKVLSQTGGNLQQQDMTGYGEQWSNDAHLWWTGAKPGDKLELALPVAQAGNYRLRAQLTKAADYAIVQLALDGQILGAPIDLFNNGVIPTSELDLGTHTLSAGAHKLTVEITGANPRAIKSYMFGLDYVKLVETR